jgi:hypothetical protein
VLTDGQAQHHAGKQGDEDDGGNGVDCVEDGLAAATREAQKQQLRQHRGAGRGEEDAGRQVGQRREPSAAVGAVCQLVCILQVLRPLLLEGGELLHHAAAERHPADSRVPVLVADERRVVSPFGRSAGIQLLTCA